MASSLWFGEVRSRRFISRNQMTILVAINNVGMLVHFEFASPHLALTDLRKSRKILGAEPLFHGASYTPNQEINNQP